MISLTKTLKYGFMALALGTLGGPARATLDSIPGSRHVSARAAALGGAFLPLGENGASALFFNPANVAKRNKAHFEPLNFQGALGINNIKAISANTLNSPSLSGYAPTLATREGEWHTAGGSVVPNFFFQGLAVGVLGQINMAATDTGSVISYKSKYQLIPAIAVGVSLARGIVRLGYSIQWVNEASGRVDVPDTGTLGFNEGLAEGSGFSHNLGFALSLPRTFLPTLNIVARNIGNLRFSNRSLYKFANNPSGKPADELSTFDVSFSIHPKIGKGATYNLVLQLRDLTNRYGFNIISRSSVGLEFWFQDTFALRMGAAGFYPSVGIGLKRKAGEFALSWFSENIGTNDVKERNMKFMLHYAIRVF